MLDKLSALLTSTLEFEPGLDNQIVDLVAAAEAAVEGGRAAMPFYRSGDLDIQGASGSPVTSADRASHRAILEFLSSSNGTDAVLSEEGNPLSGNGERGRTWIVDPLDGTREFIDRIGEFSVMVGLAVEGRAVLGAVYRPDPDLLYFGVADRAAWRVADASSEPRITPLQIQERSPNGLRFVRSRSHPDDRLQALERAMGPSEIFLSGSVGTKCALIAEGRADLYVHPVPYLKEWDTCAPEAILRGAGGKVTDCRGERLEYSKSDPIQERGIFAGRPEAWDRVAEIVFHNAKDL